LRALQPSAPLPEATVHPPFPHPPAARRHYSSRFKRRSDLNARHLDAQPYPLPPDRRSSDRLSVFFFWSRATKNEQPTPALVSWCTFPPGFFLFLGARRGFLGRRYPIHPGSTRSNAPSLLEVWTTRPLLKLLIFMLVSSAPFLLPDFPATFGLDPAPLGGRQMPESSLPFPSAVEQVLSPLFLCGDGRPLPVIIFGSLTAFLSLYMRFVLSLRDLTSVFFHVVARCYRSAPSSAAPLPVACAAFLWIFLLRGPFFCPALSRFHPRIR